MKFKMIKIKSHIWKCFKNKDEVHKTKQAIDSIVIFISVYKYKLTPQSSTRTDLQNPHKEKKVFSKLNKANGIPLVENIIKYYIEKITKILRETYFT